MGQSPDPQSLIADELKKANPDWRLIERLSRDAVDADPNSVRFSVDAGHIQRLGLELVAKQETALAELIKNAYDADATEVRVTFANHEKPGGTLIIEDNGVGMTSDVVRDAWMRISTTSKRDNPVSHRYRRHRAGKKGIGRFAVQRLGHRLILETEVAGSEVGLRATFNWDQEFQPGRHLHDVFSAVEEYHKPVDRERTRLSIFGLREAWPDATLQRVWRTVLLLQPPFPVAKRDTSLAEGCQPDPGFDVVINGLSGKKKKTEFSIEKSFLDYAIADFSGHIGPDGKAVAYLRSEKLGINESQEFEHPFLLTGPLAFSCKYFIYHAETLSGLSFHYATEMGRTYGGLRIYRNGFRVLPYGEPTDDWLRLERDMARRQLLNPVGNRHLFGHVELDDERNPLFEETSSREGLIENEAFEELRDFIRKSIEWGAIRLAAIRDRKQVASQKDFVSKARPPRSPKQVFQSFLGSLSGDETSHTGVEDGGQHQPQLPSTAQAAAVEALAELERYEEAIAAKEAAYLRYEEMLRILASLGLSVAVFGHEVKGIQTAVAAHIALLARRAEGIAPAETRDNFEHALSKLNLAASRMFDLGGYIAGLMSSTESRELSQLSVKGALERFAHQFEHYMEKQGVEFEVFVDPAELRTTEMHRSELDSVLLNFMTNSLKSMKKARVFPRKIRITAKGDDGLVLICFEDNGLGVQPEIEDRIFDAFFTTTMGADEDGVAGPGTGLGLKIVHDIANSYGGSVGLGEPSEGYTCCFQFRVLSDKGRKDEL